MTRWRARLGPLFVAMLGVSCGPPAQPLLVEETSEVVAGDESRPAVALDFPATRRLQLVLPGAAFLRVAPAVLTEQDVRRARVLFRITIETEGERTVVLEETFRFLDANRWHDREVDLTRWSGRRVALVLETGTPERRADILWAERVRAVWGSPEIVSSPGSALVNDLHRAREAVESWASDTAGPLSTSGYEPRRLVSYFVNLLLAGLLGLVVRLVYSRHASSGSRRRAAGNLFPLICMVTVLVLVLVQSSLALSLGLIGALSVVRFRSAIRTPEELGYLLLCISVGVALGADRRLLAAVAVLIVSAFAEAGSRLSPHPAGTRRLQLTLSGSRERFRELGHERGLERLTLLGPELEIQRVDETESRFEARALITSKDAEGPGELPARLIEAFPGLDLSLAEADDAP